jgi:hypothetical protein
MHIKDLPDAEQVLFVQALGFTPPDWMTLDVIVGNLTESNRELFRRVQQLEDELEDCRQAMTDLRERRE